MLFRSVYHLELNALDAGAVLRAVPVGMLVLPHDDVELAAGLVAEHETDVTMTIVSFAHTVLRLLVLIY